MWNIACTYLVAQFWIQTCRPIGQGFVEQNAFLLWALFFYFYPVKSLFPLPISSFLSNANLLHRKKSPHLYNILFFAHCYLFICCTQVPFSWRVVSCIVCRLSGLPQHSPAPARKPVAFFIEEDKLQNSLQTHFFCSIVSRTKDKPMQSKVCLSPVIQHYMMTDTTESFRR